MRITRLYLRNYRVYEQPVDLELPSGLIGIYGPNGSGKSVLLESILFCLYGRSRTTKDEIRTSGINADCVSEVEFEHEGHLYCVRRTVAGQSATVRAQAEADGSQVAEGAVDTRRYVHSVLGMDDTAFRSSVFAEQRQLAAFSSTTPAERRRLVLGLLGVTPLDGARSQARKDSTEARRQLDQLRIVLTDVDQLADELARAEAAASEAEDLSTAAAEAASEAERALHGAQAEHDRLSEMARAHRELVSEGRSKAEELKAATARVGQLQREAGDLARAESRLAEIDPQSHGVEEVEEKVRLALDVERAQRAVFSAPMPEKPPEPDREALVAAAGSAQAARGASPTWRACARERWRSFNVPDRRRRRPRDSRTRPTARYVASRWVRLSSRCGRTGPTSWLTQRRGWSSSRRSWHPLSNILRT